METSPPDARRLAPPLADRDIASPKNELGPALGEVGVALGYDGDGSGLLDRDIISRYHREEPASGLYAFIGHAIPFVAGNATRPLRRKYPPQCDGPTGCAW